MKRTFITIFLIISSLAFISAQSSDDYSLYNIIKQQLSANEQQTLTIAEKEIQTGDGYRSKANSLQQQAQQLEQQAQKAGWFKRGKLRKKAKKYQEQATQYFIKSNKNYWNGNTRIYKIYKSNLNKLLQNLTSQEAQEITALIQQADQSYNNGKIEMKKGLKVKDPSSQNTYFSKGVQLAKEAVELQQQAYSLYFDKIKQKQAKKNKKTPQTSKPATTHNQPMTTQNTYTPQPRQTPQGQIYFRVQVAASRVPLSAQKLQSIYPGKVYYEYDPNDRMYKYLTIQKFSTYQQADCFKQKINVPGAFIVAYKNGKRVKDIQTVVPHKIPCNSY